MQCWNIYIFMYKCSFNPIYYSIWFDLVIEIFGKLQYKQKKNENKNWIGPPGWVKHKGKGTSKKQCKTRCIVMNETVIMVEKCRKLPIFARDMNPGQATNNFVSSSLLCYSFLFYFRQTKMFIGYANALRCLYILYKKSNAILRLKVTVVEPVCSW